MGMNEDWAKNIYDTNWGGNKSPIANATKSMANPSSYRAYGDSYGGALGYGVADGKGGVNMTDGWGMPALNLAGSAFNTYMNYTNGQDQLELANKAFEDQQKLGWSNFALNKSNAYDARNMKMATLAKNRDLKNGIDRDATSYVDQFSDMNSLYNTQANRITDPSMNVNGNIYGGDSKLPGQVAVGAPAGSIAPQSAFATPIQAAPVRPVGSPATNVEATRTAAGMSNAKARSRMNKNERDDNKRASATV